MSSLSFRFRRGGHESLVAVKEMFFATGSGQFFHVYHQMRLLAIVMEEALV